MTLALSPLEWANSQLIPLSSRTRSLPNCIITCPINYTATHTSGTRPDYYLFCFYPPASTHHSHQCSWRHTTSCCYYFRPHLRQRPTWTAAYPWVHGSYLRNSAWAREAWRRFQRACSGSEWIPLCAMSRGHRRPCCLSPPFGSVPCPEPAAPWTLASGTKRTSASPVPPASHSPGMHRGIAGSSRSQCPVDGGRERKGGCLDNITNRM